MNSVNAFGNIFSDVLKTEFSEIDHAEFQLLKKVKDFSSTEVSQLFAQKDKLWLTKEISKWKKKVLGNEDTFNPTLQNLYIFCQLTNRTPNDVLLPDIPYNGPDQIDFLSEDALEGLVKLLQNKGRLSGDYLVPVRYAPIKMAAVFLSIYSKKIQNQENIYIQFSLSYVEKRYDEDSYGGFNTSSVDNRLLEYNVSVPEKNPYSFKDYYTKMAEAFNSVTGDLQDVVLDEFYKEFGLWASELLVENNSLCKYFPLPLIKPTVNRKKTLDEMCTGQTNEKAHLSDNER